MKSVKCYQLRTGGGGLWKPLKLGDMTFEQTMSITSLLMVMVTIDVAS